MYDHASFFQTWHEWSLVHQDFNRYSANVGEYHFNPRNYDLEVMKKQERCDTPYHEGIHSAERIARSAFLRKYITRRQQTCLECMAEQ